MRLRPDRRGRARGPRHLLSPHSDDLEVARRATREAGAALLERYGGPARGLARKSTSTDMVSDADRAAEDLIAALLERERPNDAVLGEEGAAREGNSGRRWVVDPLDGTTNYLYGLPAWAVSVALEDADGGLVAVVLDPVRDELFSAVRGQGTQVNDSPVTVRDATTLERALVATGFAYEPARRAEQAAVLQRVLPAVRDVRRAGAAALDLSWLAAGRIDAYFEHGLNPWDWAAGRLLVTEAGGVVADLPGEPAGLAGASSAELLEELLELVDG